jgi:hypothetical protein
MPDLLESVGKNPVEVLIKSLLRLGKRPKGTVIGSVLLKILLVEAAQPLRQVVGSRRAIRIRQVALCTDKVNLQKRIQDPCAVHPRRLILR